MTILSEYRAALEDFRRSAHTLARAANKLHQASVEPRAERRWSKRTADLLKIVVDVDKELEGFAGPSAPPPGQAPLPFDRPAAASTNGHDEHPHNGVITLYPRDYPALPVPATNGHGDPDDSEAGQ